MGIRRSKRYVKQRQKQAKIKQTQPTSLAKTTYTILKPALTALVFLLVSSWSQQPTGCVEKLGLVASSMRSVNELRNKEVVVGSRVLIISHHAAERMLQRGVTVANIQKAVKAGKLFAYGHGGIIKIGYFHEGLKVFLAVDKHHEKIITAIKGTSKFYIYRLTNSDLKP